MGSDPVVVRPESDRPSFVWLAILVVAILGAGLVGGLAIDAVLESRPIAILISATVAAHVALGMVYRRITKSLRRIESRAGAGQSKRS